MVNLVRRFKLEYNDASTGTTTIAETGQDTGALKIDRHVHIRNVNNPDILKLWLEGTNFGDSIPTRITEFGNSQNTDSGGTPLNEPEILYKQYDEDAGSFTTIGRFYAKNTGTINEEGELALKLYSFMRYTARQSVNTGTISTDIEDALNAVLPDGYVADVPAGVTPPSVSNYSLDSRREKGYQELTRNYKYALTFTSELDGSNNYLVKFEPVGQGGSVDTVDSSTDAVRFKAWEKDKQDSIINKVTVEGTNSSGNTLTATATNNTQINNFGEKFRKYKVGYIENSSEAQEIAESFLVPGLDENGNDITKVPESGTIKTVVYSDNIVNDSLNIIDSQRNINDTYTVVQQTNFWPEGASELELEFEKENLEEAARDAENLRDERARLYPSSQTDVGGQTIDTDNSNTTTAEADNSTQEDNQDPAVGGNTGTQDRTVEYDFNFSGASISDGGLFSVSVDAPFVAGDSEFILLSANINIDAGAGGSIRAILSNNDAGVDLFDETFGVFHTPSTRTLLAVQTGDFEGDTYELEVENATGAGGTITADITAIVIPEHTHPGLNNGGTLAAALHDHNVNVNDGGHGDTTDPTTHNLEGSTETGQNINTTTEDKTDR